MSTTGPRADGQGPNGRDPDPASAGPSGRPSGRPVVIFDGACRFCTAQAARLPALAGRELELLSFRDPATLARFPQLSVADCERALQLVLPDGRLAAGAAAIARIAALRRGLGWVASVQRLPGLAAASEAAYATIAANRFRLAGRTDDPAGCAACATHLPAAAPPPVGPLTAPRALVREAFLRGLGLVFLCAFLSLAVQIVPLIGSHGLLPVGDWLERLAVLARENSLRSDFLPTLFLWNASDAALSWTAWAGVVLSALLVAGFAPRLVLGLLWAAYLSCVNVGQDFFAFQWDNLLLEAAFFGWLVSPWTWRLSRARDRPVHPALVLLMLWLVLRLNVESGIAKWFAGDGRWADGLALDTYFETAPLPTALAWWAHQLPHGLLRVLTAGTLVLETGVPWLLFGPRRLRPVAVAALLSLQVGIAASANYGIFNLLSALLLVWGLDDGHLRRLGRWLRPGRFAGRAPGPAHAAHAAHADHADHADHVQSPAAPPARLGTSAGCWLLAAVLLPLSALPFLPWLPRTPVVAPLLEGAGPVLDRLVGWRTLNAYALFVNITTDRREIEIEGSDDGSTWLPYPFRYRPGDPLDAPGLVAPHQPRLDFQCWFLLLGGPPRTEWFSNLMYRLASDPNSVAPLLGPLPFGGRPPTWLRYSIWRYTFASPEERQQTGAYWHRELERHSSAWSSEQLAH